MVEKNRCVQDQAEYNRRFAEMDAICQKAEEQVNSLQKQILDQYGQKAKISRSMDELHRCRDSLEAFDETIWNAVAESVTVSSDGTFTFRFSDGAEVSVRLPDNNIAK